MTAQPIARVAMLALAAALTLALVSACTSGEDTDATGTPTPAPGLDTPVASTPTATVTDPDSAVTTTPPPDSGAGSGTVTGTAVPPPSGPTTVLPLPAGVVEEPAGIVSFELVIAKSFPPQYFVSIVSAQPNGCSRFSRFEVERSGPRIAITVLNTVPENLAVVSCTAIYGETMSNVALGSDFEPGETYTFAVNGAEQRFVAQ